MKGGRSLCVQQVSTVAFTGENATFASYSYTDGGSSATGTFRFRYSGTDGNHWSIQLLDLGAGQVVSQCYVKFVASPLGAGNIVQVVLKRTSLAITAKLSDVQAALSSFYGPVSYGDTSPGPVGSSSNSYCPILCGVLTDDVLSAGLTVTPLTGGVEPSAILGPLIRYDLGSTACGLIVFEIPEPVIVHQIEILNVATSDITSVSLVRLDPGLNIVASESLILKSTFFVSDSSAEFSICTTEFQLDPMMGVSLVTTTGASPGVFRVWARRDSHLQ